MKSPDDLGKDASDLTLFLCGSPSNPLSIDFLGQPAQDPA